MTTESRSVYFTFDAPAFNISGSGYIRAGGSGYLTFPLEIEVVSIKDQHKGIRVRTQSSRVTLLGQISSRQTSETFTVMPVLKLPTKRYIYFGMSASADDVNNGAVRYSSILIVGTENKTTMKLYVTQQVNVFINNKQYHLKKGVEYPYMIDEFQTVLIRSKLDLSATKVVSNKPLSVFSGHVCSDYNLCSHQVEQMPPTENWGEIFYITPLIGTNSTRILLLPADVSTTINIYCLQRNKTTRSHYIEALKFKPNEGYWIYKVCNHFCSVYSTKPILVVQFDRRNISNKYYTSMMTLVPAKKHYTSNFPITTMQLAAQAGLKHYIQVIVTKEFFQRDKIFLISQYGAIPIGTQFNWTRIAGKNNITEAYATVFLSPLSLRAEIYHSNQDAKMTYMIYGFVGTDGYGHTPSFIYSKGIINFVYSTATVFVMFI